jgi:hypothetical protein
VGRQVEGEGKSSTETAWRANVIGPLALLGAADIHLQRYADIKTTGFVKHSLSEAFTGIMRVQYQLYFDTLSNMYTPDYSRPSGSFSMSYSYDERLRAAS